MLNNTEFKQHANYKVTRKGNSTMICRGSVNGHACTEHWKEGMVGMPPYLTLNWEMFYPLRLAPRPTLFSVLRSALTIIHGCGRVAKNGKAWYYP